MTLAARRGGRRGLMMNCDTYGMCGNGIMWRLNWFEGLFSLLPSPVAWSACVADSLTPGVDRHGNLGCCKRAYLQVGEAQVVD